MLRLIRINIVVFLGLLLLLEFSGQVISLVWNGKFLFFNPEVNMRSQIFKYHPYLSVALKSNINISASNDKQYKTVRTTAIGTRWTGADLNDSTKIRVACMGGSTTFCTGVNDEDSWPAKLQKQLGDRYAVINYGVPAYKTTEAIIQMALYVPELKPDFVIFYQGVNDMYNYFLENNYPDYYYHADHVMPTALLGKDRNELGFDKFKRQSGFFYIIRNVGELFVKPVKPVKYSEPDHKVDYLYKRNLRTLFTLSNQLQAKTFLISQVLSPYTERHDTPHSIRIRKELVMTMMSRMNGFGKEVCDSSDTCSFLDFENTISWKPEHFWDEMHFTEEGSELFAKRLAEEITAIPLPHSNNLTILPLE